MSDNCFQKISSLRQPQKFFDIIDCIDKKKWDKAKTIWLVDICNKIPLGEKKRKINVYGGEYEHFLQYIIQNQKYISNQKCLNPSCSQKNPKKFECKDFNFNLNKKKYCGA